jgi:N-acyl-D-amino-acid deacylase
VSLVLGHTPYFYENIGDIYTNPTKIAVLEEKMQAQFEFKGFSVELMMLCDAACGKYRAMQGRFVPDILRGTGMTMAEFCIDLYRESSGAATLYFLFEQDEANVPRQMTHPHVLYMTDAWYQPGSHQNACAYGSLPAYLRIARETGNMTMEQAVSHMTGLTADRFSLHGRGYLRNGYAADVVVFDPKTVRDRATEETPDVYAAGIRHVFVNGSHLLNNGEIVLESGAGGIL